MHSFGVVCLSFFFLKVVAKLCLSVVKLIYIVAGLRLADANMNYAHIKFSPAVVYIESNIRYIHVYTYVSFKYAANYILVTSLTASQDHVHSMLRVKWGN